MVTRNQLIGLGLFVIIGAGFLWYGREDTSRTDNPELKRRAFMQGQAPDASLAPPVGDVSSAATSDHPAPPSGNAPEGSLAVSRPDFEFPASPTKELFLSKCTVCHSLKYITMQNDFSKEFWQEETEKMISEYHARISQPEANAIVQYLSTIKR